MRRIAPTFIAAIAVAATAGLMTGAPGDGLPLIFIVPLAIGILAWSRFSARSTGTELRWAARTAAANAPVARIVGGPTAPAVTARRRAAPNRRTVTGALARFESRHWLASPWFGAGVGFCLLQVWLFGWVWAADNDGSWRGWFVLMPIMAHPMVGMAVIGAHHAVTRARRDGVEELFAACPADETVRTIAQLRAGWVPAAVTAAFVVVASGLLAVRNQHVYGPIDGRAVADGLTAVVLTLSGSALGVALARWAPWRLVPVAVVAALVPVILEFGTLGQPHWSNARQLSTWPQYPDHELLFTDPPQWWHLLWLGALGGLMVWLALVHASRSRSMVLTGVAVALVVAVAAIAETRPLSATAAEQLASMVAEPTLHQSCRAAPGVEVCVYADYEEYVDVVLANVAPVAAARPRAAGTVTFRQVFDGELAALGPEVADALDGRSIPAGGFLPLGFLNRDEAMDAARLTIALDAVGLPPASPPDGVPTVIAGEARGVVVLWLAARGLDASDAQHLATTRFNPDDHADDYSASAFDFGMAWPDPCLAGSSPPVAWSTQDLRAARELLALPEGEVHGLLLDNWELFTDASTSTDELMAAAGLEPVGPFDDVVAAPVVCNW